MDEWQGACEETFHISDLTNVQNSLHYFSMIVAWIPIWNRGLYKIVMYCCELIISHLYMMTQHDLRQLSQG